MKRIFGKKGADSHDFWMSYTDMMSAFLIVFMIGCIYAYNGYQNKTIELENAKTQVDSLLTTLRIENPDSLRNKIFTYRHFVDSINSHKLSNEIECYRNVFVETFYTQEPYSGIFHIKDSKSGGIGLRDRYGILVKPEYERLAYHDKRQWFGTLELRKNGCYTLYDVCNNSFSKDNAIRHELQDSVCRIIDSHFKEFAYEINDRLEVIVKDYATGNAISHVKASINNTTYYNYGSEPYIKAGAIVDQPEGFVADTVCINGYVKQIKSYSHDVKRDSVAMYNIFIQAARSNQPQNAELLELAGKIESKLKPN